MIGICLHWNYQYFVNRVKLLIEIGLLLSVEKQISHCQAVWQ